MFDELNNGIPVFYQLIIPQFIQFPVAFLVGEFL